MYQIIADSNDFHLHNQFYFIQTLKHTHNI
jgi:hypothetical protein